MNLIVILYILYFKKINQIHIFFNNNFYNFKFIFFFSICLKMHHICNGKEVSLKNFVQVNESILHAKISLVQIMKHQIILLQQEGIMMLNFLMNIIINLLFEYVQLKMQNHILAQIPKKNQFIFHLKEKLNILKSIFHKKTMKEIDFLDKLA